MHFKVNALIIVQGKTLQSRASSKQEPHEFESESFNPKFPIDIIL